MTLAEVITMIVTYGPSIITAAAVIAAVTPTPVDDGVLAVLRKIVDVLALNVGHATNKGNNTEHDPPKG